MQTYWGVIYPTLLGKKKGRRVLEAASRVGVSGIPQGQGTTAACTGPQHVGTGGGPPCNCSYKCLLGVSLLHMGVELLGGTNPMPRAAFLIRVCYIKALPTITQTEDPLLSC